MNASPVPVWVLLGSKHGDNQQLLALAEALALPFRVIQLHFTAAVRVRPALLGASRLGWRSEALGPPWPRLVLAAGRKSAPAALWVRRESGGRTRLIHVNRPWAPLDWFDLVVSTPQYALPARANVVANLLPLLAPPGTNVPLPPTLHTVAASLPRPWTLVLVGGDSRPYVLDDACATNLAALVNTQVRGSGGSAWVLASPRTPAAAVTLIEARLEVPAKVVRWGEADNPYRALLGSADRFIVTADSASMLAEALASGRPVTPIVPTVRPDRRWRFAAAWRDAAARAPSSLLARAYAQAVELGVLTSVRDGARLLRALEAAGVFASPGKALELAGRERAVTLARIAALIDGA